MPWPDRSANLDRGVNGAVSDKKMIDTAIDELTQITGQRAVPTMSKKDISNFKLRKNMPIGARVTLRGEKMYEFLDRLVSVALPRVPFGFHGSWVPTSVAD